MKTVIRLSTAENRIRARRSGGLSLVLIILAAALILSSCGIIIVNPAYESTGGGDPETTARETLPGDTGSPAPETVPHTPVETEDYEAAADKNLESLTDRDFGGLGIMIACVDSELWQAETDSGYAQAVSIRNNAVKNKYNVTLAVMKDSAENLLAGGKAAYNSGDYFADLLALPASSLGAFAVSGLLGNARSLPFTDFSAEYFDNADIEQLSAGNFTYAVTGAATKKTGDMYGLLFNKEAVAELGLASIYPQVYNGSWTWDVMLQYMKAASDTGSAAENGETAGISITAAVSETDNNRLLYAMFASTGQTFMNTAYGMTPVRAFNSSATEGIIGIYNSVKTLVSGKSDTARAEFAGGGVLFLLTKMTGLEDFSSVGFAWGALPLPKYDESGEYGTYCPDQTLLAASSSTGNIDYAGLVLQALNAASYGRIKYALNSKLKNEVVSDTDTLNMLGIIYEGAYADFASSFAGTSGAVKNATLEALKSAAAGKNLTSIYSQTETALAKFLDSLK